MTQKKLGRCQVLGTFSGIVFRRSDHDRHPASTVTVQSIGTPHLRLSRTVLCISIPRRNGHRTAERVKNTGTGGRSTGICGHTGQTTLSTTCVCLLSASIAAAAPAVAAEDLAGDHIANFEQKVFSCELTAEAPIHVEARGK
ncbi:hypothetical protein SFRURICE_008315 [Spodoptera frugiperda]|nr:hypothetical protein SFRURICE_008315 [Spodoptera frugiperda]